MITTTRRYRSNYHNTHVILYILNHTYSVFKNVLTEHATEFSTMRQNKVMSDR